MRDLYLKVPQMSLAFSKITIVTVCKANLHLPHMFAHLHTGTCRVLTGMALLGRRGGRERWLHAPELPAGQRVSTTCGYKLRNECDLLLHDTCIRMHSLPSIPAVVVCVSDGGNQYDVHELCEPATDMVKGRQGGRSSIPFVFWLIYTTTLPALRSTE